MKNGFLFVSLEFGGNWEILVGDKYFGVFDILILFIGFGLDESILEDSRVKKEKERKGDFIKDIKGEEL